jgi:hypothetical protein
MAYIRKNVFVFIIFSTLDSHNKQLNTNYPTQKPPAAGFLRIAFMTDRAQPGFLRKNSGVFRKQPDFCP